MPELFVGEEHVQVYDLWRSRGARGLRLAHVDFHCDMRGLLIDRRRGRAYPIDRGDRRMRDVDSGNFLAHAVVEGIVTRVCWIHDTFGGRLHDTGTVKYESDVTAVPHRVLHALRGGGGEVDVDFEEVTFDRWQGPHPDEPLDIDWDGIGSIEYDVPRIRRLMREFLDRDFSKPPAETYLVVSPGYSHPDTSLFDEFLAGLESKLGVRAQQLPPYAGPPHLAAPTTFVQSLEKRVGHALKRIGIY